MAFVVAHTCSIQDHLNVSNMSERQVCRIQTCAAARDMPAMTVAMINGSGEDDSR